MIRATVCSESGERVIGELVGHRIEILRRIWNPCRTGRQHRRCQRRLRLHGTLHHHLILLGKEVGFIGGEDRCERIGTRLGPKQRLSRSIDGNRAGRSDIQLEGCLPGKKQCDARGGDAGEHGVRIHVHAFDQIRHRAAPSDMFCAAAVRCDGLPCRRLIEVREQRSRQRNGVGIDLRLGCGSDQRAGIGHNRGAAGVEEVLHPGQRGIERECASALRSLQRNRQQLAHRIRKPRRSGPRLRKRGIRSLNPWR